jgi:hypothetical protein
MKKTMLLIAMAIGSVHAFAQDYEDEQVFKFGLGGTISVPLSDLKLITTYGIGFEATAVYNFSENIAGFAQGGINVFKGKMDFGQENSVLNIPILAGARYKINGFFAGAGIGYSSYHSSGWGSGTSGFTYSPQIGYDMGSYQFLLHYTSTSVTGGSLSYVGLKAFHTF